MSIIRAVETFHLRIGGDGGGPRFERSAAVRSVYPRAAEILLVRIETDTAIGWGESLSPAPPEAPRAVIDNLLAPLLLGCDLADGVAPLIAMLQDSNRERGHLVGHQADALAGVDIALWDAFGRQLGVPVAALLGGVRRHAVPVYRTDLSGDQAEATAAAGSPGISRFKVHIAAPPEESLALYDRVVELVGGQHRDVALDAHWVHGLGAAHRLAAGLDDRGAWFFEAPLAPEDRDGAAALAESHRTPIAIGEALRNRFEFSDWASARALGLAQPDIGRTGITESVAIGHLLEARHIAIAPHHSMATAIAYAAAVHVGAAAPLFDALEWAPSIGERSRGLVDDLDLLVPADGAVQLPIGPGLGIDVDESAVRRAAL